MSSHTKEAITELVNRLIDAQVADGLHNDSPLSFRDIRDIKQCFISRLQSMYHARVSYPPEVKRTPQTTTATTDNDTNNTNNNTNTDNTNK
jgi:membrane-associated HD superfamily phosphohydrolase